MSQLHGKFAPIENSDRVLKFHPADPVSARTVSKEQIIHYNREGYISPIDLYSSDEMVEIRTYIDNLLQTVLEADDQRNAYSINNYHAVCARLWDIVVEPRISSLVIDILGQAAVCWGSHFFIKLPHDNKTVPFHQDAVYWPLTPSKTVTVWLAIDDTDADNAAMQFVPGSHIDGPLAHEKLALDGTRVLGRQALGMEARPARFLNALKAGQLSLHSDLILHGSAPNSSERRRAGLTLRYAAADVRLLEGNDAWRKSSVHIGKGDAEGFWNNKRRPDGEHPEKMSWFWGEFDGQPREQE